MLEVLRYLFAFAAVDDGSIERACGPDRYTGLEGICAAVMRATGGATTIAQFAGHAIPGLLRIALIIVLAAVATYLTRRVIRRFVDNLTAEGAAALGPLGKRGRPAEGEPDFSRAAARARTIAAVLRSISTAVIWTLAVLMILGVLNIPLGPLIAGAGIGGIAFGFGAQTMVRDFLAGIFILLEDQYGLGDIVDLGEANGVVEGVTLRTTRLRDVQGSVWYVPNGEIRRVGNKSQQWARALLDIGVAYSTDVEHATAVMKRVADDVWQDPEWSDVVLDEPEVWGLEDFGADQLTMRLVVKTVPSQQFKVNREIRRRLKAAFDSEGIEIPFPQRTVWLRGDESLKAAAAGDGRGGEPAKRTEEARDVGPDAS